MAYVNLSIPDFAVTLGGFDLTPYARFAIELPSVGITVPQAKTGTINIDASALVATAALDDRLNPSRWLRGQQSLVISIRGIQFFTGYILKYRFDRQTRQGVGEIGDQIALQDFERVAVEIPITVSIRDRTQADAYAALIDRQRVGTRSYTSVSLVQFEVRTSIAEGVSASAPPSFQNPSAGGSVSVALPPAPAPLPIPRPDVFIFQGTDVSDIAQNLAIESGKINGTQIFSNVLRPSLTGEISTPIVTTNPIQEAQKYAGVDFTFMYTNPSGQINWRKYPTAGSPIFQLTEDQCDIFQPDLTVDREWFESVIVSGQISIQSSNPDYLPERLSQTVTVSPSGQTQGGLVISSTTVTNAVLPPLGEPYLIQSIPIAGKANFTTNGITTYLPTTVTINVGYLYSIPQANNLANFLGNLQVQKANSYLVKMPILDAWLNNSEPFQICHIGDCALIMDGVQLVVDANEAYIAFTGNKFGDIPTITDPNAPPATPTPTIIVDIDSQNVERDLSDIGAIETSVSDIFQAENDYSGFSPIVGGFAQWHRSEEAIGLNFGGDAIATWGDLSGNGLDFLGASGSEPLPELLSRINGKQVINFISVNNAFFLSDILVSNPCTFYLGLRTQSWTGSRRIFGCGDLSLSVNGTTLTVTVGLTSLTRTLALNTWAPIAIIVDGANSRFKVGSSEVVGNLADFAADFLVIGAAAAFRLAEFVRYPFAFNATDRGRNDLYLQDRYDFTNRAADADIVGTPAPIVPPVDIPQPRFIYLAYADDAIGTGFTNTFNSSKDYVAFKNSVTAIATPIASDFTGLWKLYKGANGAAGTNGLNADPTRTSTTSNAIGSTGSRTFAYSSSSNLAFVVGSRVRAINTIARYIEGVVTAVSATSVTFTADFSLGSGTFTSWVIAIAGERGSGGSASYPDNPTITSESIVSNSVSSITGTNFFSNSPYIVLVNGIEVTGLTRVSLASITFTAPTFGSFLNVKIYGANGYAIFDGSVIDADAQNYIDKSVAAGNTVSSSQTTAINSLIVALKTNNLWNKIGALWRPHNATFAGSNIFYKHPNTNLQMTINNFVSGDFNINGLKGNGTDKWANLNFTPSQAGITPSNSTLSVKLESAESGGYVDIGANVTGGTPAITELDASFSGLAYLFSHSVASGQFIESANAITTGRYTGSRFGTNDLIIRKNKAALLSLTTTTNGTLPAINLFAWAENLNGSQTFHSARRMSEIMVGVGLTAAEIDTYEDIMNTFATAIGA